MKIIRPLSYNYAKTYDVITVGPYANRIGKAISSSRKSLKILTVQEDNVIMEPSLIPTGRQQILLKQKNCQFSDAEMGVGIKKIQPDKSCLTLKNGIKYFYKNLVYSGSPSDWKAIPNSKPEGQHYQSSFVQNDLDYGDLNQLFARRGGSIVFTIPKDIHFGNQNFFMMLLKDKIQQNRKRAPFLTQPLQITVLYEGCTLIPFNQAYNDLLETYLQKSNIKVLKNVNFSVNLIKRKIKIENTQTEINFDSLFQYLPLKVPQVLKQAKIDPFQINRHFLSHSRYENIYLVGNVVNNVYSFASVLKMSEVICQNVLNSCQKIQKRAIYQGNSKINIWLNERQCHQIQTDYDGSRLKKNFGVFQLTRQLMGSFNKAYLRKLTEMAINKNHFRFQFGKRFETLNTERNQVPVRLGQLNVA